MRKIKTYRKGRIRAFLLGVVFTIIINGVVVYFAPLPTKTVTEYIIVEDDGCFVRDGRDEIKLRRLTIKDIEGML